MRLQQPGGGRPMAWRLLNSLKSLLTHTVYGLGLYLAALVTASLLTSGS
jgi:hypothetical protein